MSLGRTWLCSLTGGGAHSAWFSSNGDRLARGQLSSSPLWVEGSGLNVVPLPYTNWPARAHLLVLSSWARLADGADLSRLLSPGMSVLVTYVNGKGWPELWTAVYFTSNDHVA